MKRQDFSYTLPKRNIAFEPLDERTDSRLMVIAPNKECQHRLVTDLPEFLDKGDVVVVNNTRVFPARLLGTKSSGGRVEVMIERLLSSHTARAFIKTSRTPKKGSALFMDGGFKLTFVERDKDLYVLKSDPSIDIRQQAEIYGHVPLPPYIKRNSTMADRERYQTVFARETGAVAAPTAGLHFDHSIIRRVKDKGAIWCEITLHIGSGTFSPVRVDNLDNHYMNSEQYHIPQHTCAMIQNAKKEGRRVIAVGTTTVRCLEGSAAANNGQIRAGLGETSIFIKPGYQFNVIDVLFTNFHLPESTLLMLVASFGGYDCMMAAYREAVLEDYRFFSYGDACLIFRDKKF